MSYEGYTQFLCPDGHYWTECETYGNDPEGGFTCPVCERKPSWSNSVDDTNCDRYGHIEMVELTPSAMHTCSCGNNHIAVYATYKPSMTREEWIKEYEKRIKAVILPGQWCSDSQANDWDG
jgi:hypothetical protein